jgi:AcrR family transcriptional regulator
MKLTTKGEATRRRIIEGASAYLRSESPGRVTLDDIRAITGTSKGQLFHYFPGGKEELLLDVARFEAARVIDDQQPHLGSLTTWPAWIRWRNAVVARYRAQGPSCPLATLMGEIGSTPGAAPVVTTLLQQWQGHLGRGIASMQQAGEVDPGLDADRAAAALVAGIQGGVQVLRATGSCDPLEAVLDLLLERLRTPSGATG